MPLSAIQVETVIKDHGDAARAEWERLAKLDKIVGGEHDKPTFENSSEARKYDKLWKASTLNLVGQVVNAYRQRLAVDGYRADRVNQQTSSTPWTIWTRSGMDAHQKRLYSAAYTHGYSYLFAASSTQPPGAVIKTVTGRQVFCHYDDPDDDWPDFALQIRKAPGEFGRAESVWRVWDDEQIWTIPMDRIGSAVRFRASVEPHGIGKVPFSRLESDWGAVRARGLVAPLVPLNDMINRITFVLNLIGEHSSSALRYMTGVEPKIDPETGKPIEPSVGPNKLMILSDPAGRMGQLDPSDPTGLLNYWTRLIEKFFSIAQLPPHYMIGQIANLSAEALLAAESTFAYALDDGCRTFGLGIDRALRLGSAIAGDLDAAADPEAKVWWDAVQAKSLSAEVDAWGKAVTMLGVPPEVTWERIPGVSRQDADNWLLLRERSLASDVDTMTEAQMARLMGGEE